MIPDAVVVRLKPEERAVLEARLRAPTTEQREVFRARVVLLAAGRATRSIARELGTMPRTVSCWRGRFAEQGLAGLEDKPRPDPLPKYGPETGQRILAALDQPPPAGYARWTGPLIAGALGDVHEQQVGASCASRRLTSPDANPGDPQFPVEEGVGSVEVITSVQRPDVAGRPVPRR
jgi:transposase